MTRHHQQFVSLVERLFEAGRKPSNVVPLPQPPLLTERQIAEMTLKQLEVVVAVVSDIGLIGMARANKLFVQRMREQLERQRDAQ